jgi:hypothetical protein
MSDIRADDKCRICYRDFADHNYQDDNGESVWVCPIPHQESGYGAFKGGDPRDFHPDHESCSDKEIANWKAACDQWCEAEDAGVAPGEIETPSCCLRTDSGRVLASTRLGGFGIGVYTVEFETSFELLEKDDEQDE